jgi:septation ring formation regulator EzrA
MSMLQILRAEQAKHKAGSDLQKLLCWAELHIADQFDRIHELEEELQAVSKDNERRCTALSQSRAALEALGRYILAENFDLPLDTFMRDLAPFKNVMAAHGVGVKSKTRGKKP